MRTVQHSWWPMALLLIGAPLAGCGSQDPQRYELSGTVTYAGRPMPAGYILLAPDTSSGNGGPASQADIRDGRYRLPLERGIFGGPYVATIYGFDGVRSEENGIVNALGKPIVSGYRLAIDLPRAAGVSDFAVPAAPAPMR